MQWYCGAKCPHCGANLAMRGPEPVGAAVLPATPLENFKVKRACPLCGKEIYLPSEGYTVAPASWEHGLAFLWQKLRAWFKARLPH